MPLQKSTDVFRRSSEVSDEEFSEPMLGMLPERRVKAAFSVASGDDEVSKSELGSVPSEACVAGNVEADHSFRLAVSKLNEERLAFEANSEMATCCALVERSANLRAPWMLVLDMLMETDNLDSDDTVDEIAKGEKKEEGNEPFRGFEDKSNDRLDAEGETAAKRVGTSPMS